MIAKYIPVYIDDEMLWIERGVAPWPVIQHEARMIGDEVGEYGDVLRYEGLEEHVRVSDSREEPHPEGCEPDAGDDDAVDAYGLCDGCCRTITAHRFRLESR